MKKALFAVMSLIVLALAACTTTPTGAPQTPEAIAKQFCPSALIALTSLQALDGISASNTATLGGISKVVTPVCVAVQAGTLVAPLDLKTFAANTAPVLTSIVKDSNMDPAKKNRILLDIAVAQIAIAALP